jgi:peptidyl-prolyl cis-trans isomerase SurA
MIKRTCLAIALFVGTICVTAAPNAEASITERVVAVVGERPILLSELRQRARPHLQRYSQAALVESEVLKAVLQRMIDERLEASEASRVGIAVTNEEIDNALRAIATQARLTPEALLEEAKKQGLSEQEYRDELRRQVLEGKLVQLRVRSRVRVTEEDARAAYAKWIAQSGATTPFSAVEDRMRERALEDALGRARDAWLRELRRQVYVEVRL